MNECKFFWGKKQVHEWKLFSCSFIRYFRHMFPSAAAEEDAHMHSSVVIYCKFRVKSPSRPGS